MKKNVQTNKFDRYNDEELLNLVKSSIEEYTKYKKSFDKTKDVLSIYDKHSYCWYNKGIEEKMNELVSCAKKRKLKIPKNWYNVNYTIEDMISRIYESKRKCTFKEEPTNNKKINVFELLTGLLSNKN